MMLEKEFTIQEPDKPIYMKIIVALILAMYFTIIYYFLGKENFTNYIVNLLLLTLVVFNWILIPNLSRKTIHINFSNKQIKYETNFIFFSIKKRWKPIKNPEYISVFNSKEGFEVNLWHNKNKIINLFMDTDINTVIEKAFIFSDKFDIDLLDARERGYHKWIDKKHYKAYKKIKYID